MAASLLLKLGSIIDKKGGVLVAIQHNKCAEINGAHIDVARTPLNYCLTVPATPEAISLHAKIQMLKAGIEKPRKNCVLAVKFYLACRLNDIAMIHSHFLTIVLSGRKRTLRVNCLVLMFT